MSGDNGKGMTDNSWTAPVDWAALIGFVVEQRFPTRSSDELVLTVCVDNQMSWLLRWKYPPERVPRRLPPMLTDALHGSADRSRLTCWLVHPGWQDQQLKPWMDLIGGIDQIDLFEVFLPIGGRSGRADEDTATEALLDQLETAADLDDQQLWHALSTVIVSWSADPQLTTQDCCLVALATEVPVVRDQLWRWLTPGRAQLLLPFWIAVLDGLPIQAQASVTGVMGVTAWLADQPRLLETCRQSMTAKVGRQHPLLDLLVLLLESGPDAKLWFDLIRQSNNEDSVGSTGPDG